jgi:hypothetical protein
MLFGKYPDEIRATTSESGTTSLRASAMRELPK